MSLMILVCVAELGLFVAIVYFVNSKGTKDLIRMRSDLSQARAELRAADRVSEEATGELAYVSELLTASNNIRDGLLADINALSTRRNDEEVSLRKASGFVGTDEEVNHQFNNLFALNQTISSEAHEWCRQIDTAIAETDYAVSEAIDGFMGIAERSDQTAKEAQEILNGTSEVSIFSLADRATETLSKFTQNNDQSAAEVSHLSSTIDATLAVSGKMYKLLDDLEHIHGQTNMLSFNASLESARVGKAGGGVAVVATELRRLSGRSEAAALQMRQLTVELEAQNVEVQSGLASVSKVILERSSKTEHEMSSVLVLICDTLLNSQKSVTNLTGLSQQVVADIGNVVTALQFQDLLRQRLEHVSRPLKNIGSSTLHSTEQMPPNREGSNRWPTAAAGVPIAIQASSDGARHPGMPPTLEIVSYERVPEEADNITLF